MLKCPTVDTELMSQHLLCGLHYVPTAAVVHVRPFLRLLTEAHRLIRAFGELTVKRRHEGVCRSRPVTVRMTCISMVTAVTHVAVTLQHTQNENTKIWSRVETLNRQRTVALLV